MVGATIERTRIFILEDHDLVREMLVTLLDRRSDIEITGTAGNSQEALEGIGATLPDVAILDVRLPGEDGIEICRQISSAHPSVKCLMFTGHPDESLVADAIMAGASGYISKSVGLKELPEIIHHVARGGKMIDPSSAEQVIRELARPSSDEPEPSLTDQERRVLELIGEGLTNREIAARLSLAEQTVKNYVSTLLAKLKMERRTQAAVYAAQMKAGDRP